MKKPPLAVSTLAAAIIAAGALVVLPTPASAAEPRATVHTADYPSSWRSSSYDSRWDSYERSTPPTISMQVEHSGTACWRYPALLVTDIDSGEWVDVGWLDQSICPGQIAAVSVEAWEYDWEELPPGRYGLELAEYYSSPTTTPVGEVTVIALEGLGMQASTNRATALAGQPVSVTAQLQARWSDGTTTNAPGGWSADELEALRLEFRPSGGAWSAVSTWQALPSRTGTATFAASASRSGDYRVTSRYGSVRASAATPLTVHTITGPYTLIKTTASTSTALAGQTVTLRTTATVRYSDGVQRLVPAGTQVAAQFKPATGGAWDTKKTGTVGANGAAAVTVKPSAAGQWRLVVAGKAAQPVTVQYAKPTRDYRLRRADAAPEPVRRGRLITVSSAAKVRYTDGVLRPMPAGWTFWVQFQPQGSTRWQTVNTTGKTTLGQAKQKVRAYGTGKWRIRVGPAQSRPDHVVVRR